MSGYLQRLIARSGATRSAIQPQSQLPQTALTPLEQFDHSELNTAPEHLSRETQRAQNSLHSAPTEDAVHQEDLFSHPTSLSKLGEMESLQVRHPARMASIERGNPSAQPESRPLVNSANQAPTERTENEPENHTQIGAPLQEQERNTFRLMNPVPQLRVADTASPIPLKPSPQDKLTTERALGTNRLNPINHPLPPLGNQYENETTEVHVHIGRIEVTAVQGETAARRTPVTRRKPQSLDDYLAKRSKP